MIASGDERSAVLRRLALPTARRWADPTEVMTAVLRTARKLFLVGTELMMCPEGEPRYAFDIAIEGLVA